MIFHNQLVNPDSTKCETDTASHALILSDVLSERYEYEEAQLIKFGIEDIRMPTSTRPTGEFKLEFYQSIDGFYRLVDIGTAKDKLRAVAGGLKKIKVVPKLGTTYTEDTMTFTIELSHKILKGGFITVVIPNELSFVGTPTCLDFSSNFESTANCRFTVADRKFVIKNGFEIADYDKLETPLTFKVTGIFTPRSVMPTRNFEFETFDGQDYIIDTHSTFFLPEMKNALEITEVRIVQQGDSVVGENSKYDVLVKSPYPLMVGDLLTFTVPDNASVKNLFQTYRGIRGSLEQSYLSEDLIAMLLGVN